MTFIKICGITNLSDALAAVDAGADALGFNFYRPSPRHITPQRAHEIIARLPSHILTVGVFVNEESAESVRQISTAAGVSALQLHGDESPEYCAQLADQHVIKVLGVGNGFSVSQAVAFPVEAIMLDARDDKLHGGTGRVIDWSTAQQVRTLVPKLFLAGGLSPENVRQAIVAVSPYAVDACSALEDAPGTKNHDRVRAFVKAVRDVKP